MECRARDLLLVSVLFSVRESVTPLVHQMWQVIFDNDYIRIITDLDNF